MSLDAWPIELANEMRGKGNSAVNAIYEASLPSARKPTENDSVYTVESFIRDKYVRRLWYKDPSNKKKNKKLKDGKAIRSRKIRPSSKSNSGSDSGSESDSNGSVSSVSSVSSNSSDEHHNRHNGSTKDKTNSTKKKPPASSSKVNRNSSATVEPTKKNTNALHIRSDSSRALEAEFNAQFESTEFDVFTSSSVRRASTGSNAGFEAFFTESPNATPSFGPLQGFPSAQRQPSQHQLQQIKHQIKQSKRAFEI